MEYKVGDIVRIDMGIYGITDPQIIVDILIAQSPWSNLVTSYTMKNAYKEGPMWIMHNPKFYEDPEPMSSFFD